MPDRPTTCPTCGSELPAGAPRGLCPRCLRSHGLGPDGDLTLGFERAMAAGVLETLAATIGPMPRVLLPDTQGDNTEIALVKPSSPEMPALANRPMRVQLLGEIARGGMGAVLKGRDPDLGRDLAVKVLLESHCDQPDLVRRFVEEAQIGGQLQHPGIVPIYELGTFGDSRPYFTMKLVKGETLTALLAGREAPAGERPRLLGIFEVVAQTMAYAHARGVIHRDLKPSNVMVGSFGEVQVMDWGLAKVLPRGGVVDDASAGKVEIQETVISTARSATDSDLSQSGSIMGTPSYMAPEQARGETEKLDERCDVFALGSMLCEILTGQPAFVGRSAGEIQRKAALGDLADAVARLDACGADAELIALAKDCLAREPEDRPRDAGSVTERVTAYLAGVQEKLRGAEVARATEQARAEEEAKRRVLADELAREAQARAEGAVHTAEAAEARAKAEHRARRLTAAVAALVLGLIVLGSGGYGWVQWQRNERQTRTAQAVDEALAEAARLRGEAQAASVGDLAPWGEALAAAKRADDLLDQGEGDAPLHKRVKVLLAQLGKERADARERAQGAEADRILLGRLESIRAEHAEVPVTDRTDAKYGAAFRAAGLDLDHIDPKQAGAWVAASTAPVELAGYLDDWAFVRRQAKAPEAAWHRLVEAARAADPEPWRDALRAKVETRDASAFVAMADDEQALSAQPAASLVLLALQLKEVAGDRDRAERVLRRAWQRDPGDYWVNYALAQVTNPEEALRFLTAAVAVRPRSVAPVFLAMALNNYGVTLTRQGRNDEAISTWREVLRLRPDLAEAHANLGNALHRQGNLDEAIVEYREAVRIRPDLAQPHYFLGFALQSRGRLDDAITEYTAAIRARPDHAQARENLGKAMIELERWKDAADFWALNAAAAPGNVEWQYEAALALLAANPEGEAYRKFAAATLDRLGGTDDPRTALGVARAGLLAPGVTEQPARLVELAGKGLAQNPNEPWRIYLLGLALYRAERYQEAIQRLTESGDLDPNWEAKPLNWPVLAMSHHRLGHADEAAAWLARADQVDGKAMSIWWDWLEFRLLRREARALMGIPPLPADPFAR
jgi:eukaryotic-like serine/threonine-protein kinase